MARVTNAQWLARMRWGALAIQAASILVAERLLGLELPTAWMWGLLAVGAVSNLWLSLGSVEVLGGFLVLDVALLTGMLVLSGGPSNPFSIIYVVYIAMSAVMLSGRWTWTIAALSMVSFGALFYFHIPTDELGHHGDGENFQTHLYGMFVAFMLATVLIAYFVSRLSDALKQRERALAEAQERTHRWGRLASIATLAAGAAHELGTPLGTIAIAAKEIKRRAEGVPGAEALIEDANLIREELERCRAVLDRMALTGGEYVGEAFQDVDVEELFSEVRGRLEAEQARRWETHTTLDTLSAPREAVLQMIENITRNGFDACQGGRVSLDVEGHDGEVELRFVDEGSGMDAEEIKRAADPFFTTKGTDDRMGLGLFLARTLVDSLGGRLTIESVVDRGTTIRVVLPRTK
ncbi:MAG: ATP-binding protein [Myxococcales bacterium]|nr:ATP-binding protein [Myxococcales bacterium]MDH3483531.1 ATP-binding protein [Myxococcales bacterium]